MSILETQCVYVSCFKNRVNKSQNKTMDSGFSHYKGLIAFTILDYHHNILTVILHVQPS